MRNFRDEICKSCNGKLYPRQCRNSFGWRKHKVSIFDDIEEVDFDCPYGITLNFLPPAKDISLREDGRKDYTGCQSCKDKMLKKMQEGNKR